MGRPRKTVAELKAAGTFRPSRHGERARETCETPNSPGADASVDPLPVPSDLDGVAADWWQRLAAALVGRVAASDGPMLSQACRWLAEEQRCRESLAELEPTSVDHGRALRAAAAAAIAADRILSNFGLTPAARAKLPPVFAFGATPKARVATRPKTSLDLASEEWHRRGNKGRPHGAEFEKLLAQFRAKK
jgi:phage terminase small subunit